MTACRALDRVLLWGFYHIPLNIPDQERFVRWDKFARPEHEAVAKYEYLVGSSVRILDSWWIDPRKTDTPELAGKQGFGRDPHAPVTGAFPAHSSSPASSTRGTSAWATRRRQSVARSTKQESRPGPCRQRGHPSFRCVHAVVRRTDFATSSLSERITCRAGCDVPSDVT